MSSVLKAALRKDVGIKGVVRSLRLQERVPGIVYGAGKEPVPFSLCARELEKSMRNSGFKSRVHTLSLEEGSEEKVLVKDLSFHPVKDTVQHIDLLRLAKGAKVQVMVPLTFSDHEQSPGLKRGGVLNVVVHDLEVLCPAESIPQSFPISLKGRSVGDSIHLSDLNLPEGLQVLKLKENATLATIILPSGLASEEDENKENQDSE